MFCFYLSLCQVQERSTLIRYCQREKHAKYTQCKNKMKSYCFIHYHRVKDPRFTCIYDVEMTEFVKEIIPLISLQCIQLIMHRALLRLHDDWVRQSTKCLFVSCNLFMATWNSCMERHTCTEQIIFIPVL